VLLQPQAVKTPWESGSCLGKASDRSYNVKTSTGSVVRRNRRHLRPGVSAPNEPSATPATPVAPLPPSPVKTMDNVPPVTPRPPPVSPKATNAKQQASAVSPQVVRSRSGRAIKPPQRLDV
jgi:hypothetical protein